MEPTYLDFLRAQLADYEAKKAKAARMLADDAEYRTKVLAGWDYNIELMRAKIAREEAKG